MNLKEKVRKGDIIGYRINLVRVLSVDDDGCLIKGPYGETQKIDWEDVEKYNPELCIDDVGLAPARTFSEFIKRLFSGVKL